MVDSHREESPQRWVRTDFSRGEATAALVWLSVAALLSVFLEVMYLGARMHLPGGATIAVPYTIVIALAFNYVLSRTAALWTNKTAVAAIPLLAWVVGFLLMTLLGPVTGDQWVVASARGVGLFICGIAGGVWPLLHRQ